MRAEGRDPQEHMCNVNTALTHSKTRNFIVTCSLFINKLHLGKCNQSRTLLTSELGRKRGEGCVHMRGAAGPPTCLLCPSFILALRRKRVNETELVSGVVFSVGAYL